MNKIESRQKRATRKNYQIKVANVNKLHVLFINTTEKHLYLKIKTFDGKVIASHDSLKSAGYNKKLVIQHTEDFIKKLKNTTGGCNLLIPGAVTFNVGFRKYHGKIKAVIETYRSNAIVGVAND